MYYIYLSIIDMAGKKSTPLNLTDRQGKILEHYQRKHSTGQQQSKRIKIILKAAQGESTYFISEDIKMSIGCVREWRRRWAAGYVVLREFEKGKDGNGVSDLSLLKKMLELLKDQPRPGAPCRITDSEKKQLLAMACRKPSDYNIARSRWSHVLLAEVAIREGIVSQISPRHVGKILKKTNFVPIKVAIGFAQK